MHYAVHIKPSGLNLYVQPGETVLAAALRQGFQFPHHCDKGSCDACRGRLLQGRVEYDASSLPTLSEDDREAGFALLCAAKPVTDLVIHIENVIGPSQLPVKKLSYNVRLLKQLTPTIYQVLLAPATEEYIIYRAGQYIEIIHRDSSPHPFSIANAQVNNQREIELHIRHVANNPYTAELIKEIQETKQLRVQGPFGNCVLFSEPAYPIIFLAGGTGIVPFKAILEQVLAQNLKIPLHLYWGTRSASDFYLEDLFKQWTKQIPHFRYTPVLSNLSAATSWSGRRGLVHQAVIEDYRNLANFRVYASGPTEMVFAALHAFLEHGLQRNFMHSDAFDYPLPI